MHGCMEAGATLQPNEAEAGQWYLESNSALQWENDMLVILGANSGPRDQIGPPGHRATTCVHHNIGNELTVEVNWQGKNLDRSVHQVLALLQSCEHHGWRQMTKKPSR